MKALFQRRFIIALGIIAFSCVIFMSSSGGGTSGGGSTSLGPISISPADTSVCRMKAYQTDASLSFTSVSLRYDFQRYRSDLALLAPDFVELSSIHPSLFSLQTGTLSGNIEWLSEITNLSDMVSDDSRKPMISIRFSDMECEATGFIFPETEVSPSQISGNTINNVHAYALPLSYIEYTIRSVKTQNKNVQLTWRQKIELVNSGNIFYGMSSDAEIVSDLDVRAIISTTVSGDSIACRPDHDNNSYDIVDIGDDLTVVIVDNFREWRPTPGNFSPDLAGPVYSGGELNEDILWEEPIILNELNEQRP